MNNRSLSTTAPAYTLDDTLITLLKIALADPTSPPLLLGEAAIGKTSVINSLADHGMIVHHIETNTLADRGDIQGVRLMEARDASGKPTGDVRQVFVPMDTIKKAYQDAIDNPDTIVLINWDEINRTDADITGAVMAMFSSRVSAGLNLPDNIRFIATGNDVGHVNELDTAKATRFSLFPVKPDAATWLRITDNPHRWIATTLEENPELILCYEGTSDEVDEDDDSTTGFFGANPLDGDRKVQVFTAPRTLTGLNDWLNRAEAEDGLLRTLFDTPLGGDHDAGSMLEKVITSHIGDTAAARRIMQLATAEISPVVQTMATQAATSAAVRPEPAEWSRLMAAPDTSTIQAILAPMDDAQRFEVFCYSLIDPRTEALHVLTTIIEARLLGSLNNADKREVVNLSDHMIPAARTVITGGDCHINMDSPLGKSLTSLSPILSD